MWAMARCSGRDGRIISKFPNSVLFMMGTAEPAPAKRISSLLLLRL